VHEQMGIEKIQHGEANTRLSNLEAVGECLKEQQTKTSQRKGSVQDSDMSIHDRQFVEADKVA